MCCCFIFKIAVAPITTKPFKIKVWHFKAILIVEFFHKCNRWLVMFVLQSVLAWLRSVLASKNRIILSAACHPTNYRLFVVLRNIFRVRSTVLKTTSDNFEHEFVLVLVITRGHPRTTRVPTSPLIHLQPLSTSHNRKLSFLNNVC